MRSTAEPEAGATSPAVGKAANNPLTDPELELFLARFERWCRGQGLAMSTVCMRVLGSGYAVERMRGQAKKTREKMRKLEDHMLEVERRSATGSCNDAG